MNKVSTAITGEVLAKLKCESCDEYLSSFPIYISQDNKNICGRCIKEPQSNLTRNVKYELLAQFVKFPCQFKKDGCPDLVFADNLPKHEEKCGYASVNCPIKDATTCNWKGRRTDVLFHCNEHPNNMLQNSEFKINLMESYESVSLAEYKGHLFTVEQNYNSEKKILEILIKKVETGKECSISEYNICVKSDSMSLFIKCAFSLSKKINLDYLKEDLSDGAELNAQIYYDETYSNPVKTLMVENPLSKEIISKFTCSLCKNCLLPPICSLPSENSTLCCQCVLDKSSTLHFRDRKLEEIANLLPFPCIYHNKGCCFVAKPEELEIHLMCCPYGDYECPLSDFINCEWFGLGRDVKSHIYEKHKDLFLTSMIINVVVEVEKITQPVGLDAVGPFNFPNPAFSYIGSSSSQSTSSSNILFPTVSTAAPSVGCSSKQKNLSNFVFRAPILSTTASSSTGWPTTSINSIMFHSQTATMSTTTPSIPIKTGNQFSHGNRLVQAMRCIRSNRKRDPSELEIKTQNETTVAKCYIINFSNKLFRLLFCKTNSVFSWYVQIIGDYEEGYIFEIEIVNKKDPISCLILRDHCTYIKDKKELFSVKNKNGCFVLEEQVANFLDNKEICFKVKLDVVNQ